MRWRDLLAARAEAMTGPIVIPLTLFDGHFHLTQSGLSDVGEAIDILDQFLDDLDNEEIEGESIN